MSATRSICPTPIPLTVVTGVQRRAVTLSIDVAGMDLTIPAAVRYGHACLRTYGADHVTLAGRAGLVDIPEAWFTRRDASLVAAALLVETAARQAALGKAGGIALANVAGNADAITADRAVGLTDVAIWHGHAAATGACLCHHNHCAHPHGWRRQACRW